MESQLILSLNRLWQSVVPLRGVRFLVLLGTGSAIPRGSPGQIWREGVRRRGKFTVTLFLSHQGRGDFSEIASPEPALSVKRFFASLRMTGSEGARNDKEGRLKCH